uniref:Uncharacterized protein n=1 Tax=Homalodisca liturata TaxID=320908 RepID=A0A1B6HMZ4_9HEMI
MVNKVSEGMVKKYSFDEPYTVSIVDREKWSKKGGLPYQRSPTVLYRWFVPFSRAVFRIYRPGANIAVPLGKHATVFQAEVLVLESCARRLVQMRSKGKGAKYLILSDSQAALKALETSFESKAAWECKDFLVELAKKNRVTLSCLPGHKGIYGSQKADSIAKKGTEFLMVGPEPGCGVASS